MMIKKIYRLPEVMNMTGLSRSSIYLRVSTNEFPKPVKIGRRAIGWPEESIIAWQAKMMGAQDESA
jgi:prophage regulatory protein